MDMQLCIAFMVLMVAVNGLDPMKEAKMIIVNNCKTKVGATEDDVKTVLAHGLPTSENGLCLVECLLTQGGMMKNSKLNKSGFLASAKREKSYSSAQAAQLEKIIDECDAELNAANLNGCQAAKKIIQCTTEKGKAIEFKFPSRL